MNNVRYTISFMLMSVGVLLILWVPVYGFMNPELTQTQVFLDQWEFFIGGSLVIFVGFAIAPIRQNERGQSLVEMTIITPLLLFVFLGLIVMGALIAQYLQILSETRDSARFGSRDDVEISEAFDERVYNEFFQESVIRLNRDEIAYAHHLITFSVGISGTSGTDCIFDTVIEPTYVYTAGLTLPPFVDTAAETADLIEAEEQFQCTRYQRQPDSWDRQVHQALIVEAQYPNPSALDLVPVNWFDDITLPVFSTFRKL